VDLLEKFKKAPLLYIAYFIIVIGIWLNYVCYNNLFYYLEEHILVIYTMIIGSFIAGSSPEGSASISYPIFTLLLKIQPEVARNFAFAIQSIGMTSASLLMLSLKVKVEWKYIKYVTFGGIFGLVAGTYLVVPFISPPMAKLFFVSLWLSFGMVLWRENRKPFRIVYDQIMNFEKFDIYRLVVFGVIGGIISSIFGTGINIFTFCLMTIYYGINEKVAVPSAIIIMTLETILGFFIHVRIIKDFQQQAFEMWIACIPFVIIFAPLGSFVMTKLPRKAISFFLYIILFIQFIGAFWVIKPNFFQISICAITIMLGWLTFYLLSLKPRKIN
jgi:uncharacterized membrane protein YfcA